MSDTSGISCRIQQHIAAVDGSVSDQACLSVGPQELCRQASLLGDSEYRDQIAGTSLTCCSIGHALWGDGVSPQQDRARNDGSDVWAVVSLHDTQVCDRSHGTIRRDARCHMRAMEHEMLTALLTPYIEGLTQAYRQAIMVATSTACCDMWCVVRGSYVAKQNVNR